MTTMYRIRTIWSGFSGAPGYTNMFFGTTDPLAAGAETAAADVKAFWEGVKAYLPNTCSVQIESAVALIEDTTGEQTDELTLASPPAPSAGALSDPYAAPAGACIGWNTSTFLGGRRIKGRTYLVPLSGFALQSDGTLNTSARSAMQTAATNLATGPAAFVVWARPREARAANPITGEGAVTARAGATGLVTAGVLKDRVAVLRSRRD